MEGLIGDTRGPTPSPSTSRLRPHVHTVVETFGMSVEHVTDNKMKEIGRGAFGVVSHGTLQVAIKKQRDDSDRSSEELQKEAKIMAHLGSHPNIVRLLGVTTISSKIYFYVFSKIKSPEAVPYAVIGDLSNTFLSNVVKKTFVDKFALILEYCQHGSLLSYLKGYVTQHLNQQRINFYANPGYALIRRDNQEVARFVGLFYFISHKKF